MYFFCHLYIFFGEMSIQDPWSFFFFNVIVFLQLLKLLFKTYFWLCWVFVAVRRLFPSFRERGLLSSSSAWASHCGGLLQSTGSWRTSFSSYSSWTLGYAGSVVVAQRPCWLMAWGIFPDQGSNLCPPSLAGGTPNHCTTRDAPLLIF